VKAIIASFAMGRSSCSPRPNKTVITTSIGGLLRLLQGAASPHQLRG
jgi:hypothetical protein